MVKEMLLIQVQKILALRDKVAVVTDLKKEVGCKDVRERVRAQLGRRDVPAQKKTSIYWDHSGKRKNYVT